MAVNGYNEHGRAILPRDYNDQWFFALFVGVVIFLMAAVLVPHFSRDPYTRAWPYQKLSASLYDLFHKGQPYPSDRVQQARFVYSIEHDKSRLIYWVWPWGAGALGGALGLVIWVAFDPDRKRLKTRAGAAMNNDLQAQIDELHGKAAQKKRK